LHLQKFLERVLYDKLLSIVSFSFLIVLISSPFFLLKSSLSSTLNNS
jgi:hypothetical protein